MTGTPESEINVTPSISIKKLCEFIQQLFPNQEFIPLHEARFLGNERKYLLDVVDSNVVSSVGKYVDQFEDMMKEFTGAAKAVATVNGTSALHIALILANVRPGDLVITQPLSFVATCNAISYVGASPLFVDIDPHTLGLSADSLELFLQQKTETRLKNIFHKETGRRIAACIPMHTFGHPVEIVRLVEICNRYNIPLLEDAAESLGSSYQGRQTGTFGLVGAYSFNGNKTITSGGGGMIVTNNEALGKRAKHLTTQAKVPHRWDFVHDQVGFNYRLPNLNAAMACAQMEQLSSFIKSKRKLAQEYQTHLMGQQELTFVSEPVGAQSNYWLNAVICQDKIQRDAVLKYSNNNGVMTRPAWQLMHRLEMFRNCPRTELPVAEWIEDRLVSIPSSVRIND